ncbi:MAG TPA: hypothetical protein VN578_21315 [Candidatus Binatia bacterium]|jgi:hypothetical protein|nr:hypothetical protein [Candidatus Binatia bacterium]
MIDERHCPFCKGPAAKGCAHLALAVEGRDFVRHCIELCHGQGQWRTLREQRRAQQRQTGDWTPDQEDFTWLETAFCEKFLKRLTWFGGMDYEWRSGPKDGQGGFWVLLWSKDPERLWWELRDELERHGAERPQSQPSAPWLIWSETR